MRSLRSFSLIGDGFPDAFAQTMAKRDALVEHEALAAPAALGFADLLQIFQDAALEVIDFGKALGQQQRARLLAADAAGAEHRDLAMPGRIELFGDEPLELAEARDPGIERALERSDRDLEGVAGVDHERVG